MKHQPHLRWLEGDYEDQLVLRCAVHIGAVRWIYVKDRAVGGSVSTYITLISLGSILGAARKQMSMLNSRPAPHLGGEDGQ